MKIPRRSFIILIVLLSSLLWPATAQENPLLEKVYSLPLVKTLESGETEIELQQVLPAPTWGVFYSFSGQFPPTPFPPNPELGLPVYFWNEGIFLFDDEGLNMKDLRESGISLFNTGNALSKANSGESFLLSDGPPAPGEGGESEESSTNSFPPAFSYTNGLWLNIVSHDSNWMTLELHGTIENGFYEILTKTNLGESSWTIDHGVVGLDSLTPLVPISVIGKSNLFFVARHSGQDEDGDGLPDWWEVENGLNPTLSDTGNTGTSDGYKDGDGDGWSNLEEFQNGTSPGGFNTPPAPRGLTVSLSSSGTVANLSWNPSGGAVTGYTIERSFYETGVDTFSVSASTPAFSDTSAPVHNNPSYYAPVYRVRANYTAGNSAWSSDVSVHLPATSSWCFLIRGRGGRPNLVSSALSFDVTALKVTRIDYVPEEPVIYEFTVPLTNFINGVAVLTEEEVPRGNYNIYWAQTVTGTGDLGDFQVISGEPSRSIPFFDGREQLKENLSFLLRAADMVSPFHFSLNFTGFSSIHMGTENYAYASFFEMFDYEEDFLARPNEFRPFEDNHHYRNFVFDIAHLDEDGQLTNGISRNTGWDVPLLTEALAPYLFQRPSATSSIPAILSSNISERIFHQAYEDQIGISDGPDLTHDLSSGAKNLFGLDYLSVRTAYGSSNGVEFLNVYPGGSIPEDGSYFYPQVAEPLLTTVDYYFGREDADPFPGSNYFSPTNTTPLIIFSGNFPYNPRLAGYAKQSIDNGDPNKFAYLGLYFDKAFKVTTLGQISTNETGILSEYGEFFPTEPGRVVLTTKPEAIGETNVGAVLIHTIKLELDVNHDGTIDRSITGPDNTSYFKPFVFWVNNDFDRLTRDHDDNEYYEDSIEKAGCPFTPKKFTADCNYRDVAGNRIIPTSRDLQDFTRLWTSGITSNLIGALSSNIAITLSWNDVGAPNAGNPTIDIFVAQDSDGGIAYLTNSSDALVQTYAFANPYVGRLGPGQSIQLNSNQFTNGWAGEHFIWCGVTNGTGALTLTISRGGTNILAQTTAHIQIKDIKQLYERWTLGDVPNALPETNAILAVEDAGPFQYGPADSTNTPYILFVHGWNMKRWEKDRFAESAFKRLYWQGYQGRFGLFRWPTDNGFVSDIWDGWSNPITDSHNYDRSELTAWNSATGLLNKLNDLKAIYPDQVYLLAHSMGNVVAGEALRLAGTNQLVNTYIASQAAIPAHVYDLSSTNLIDFTHKNPAYPLSPANFGPTTPNIYGNWFSGNSAAVGRRINFYNANDFALSPDAWDFNQELKPDDFFSGYYTYFGSTNDASPWNHFSFVPTGEGPESRDIVNNLTHRYEVMAYAAEPRSKALGATPGITNFVPVDLARSGNPIWPSPDLLNNDYRSHFWHSAQFRGQCWQQWNYWNTLLRSGSEGFNIQNP